MNEWIGITFTEHYLTCGMSKAVTLQRKAGHTVKNRTHKHKGTESKLQK